MRSLGSARVAVILLTLVVTSKGKLAAVAQKGQQVLGGMKLCFPPRVDLFDPTNEVAPEMLGLRSELNHECPTHDNREVSAARRQNV